MNRLQDRLLDKLKKNPATGCWEWQGKWKSEGYGRLNHRGRSKQAHRIAYRLYCDRIPPGAVVRHKCDNRLCCNPVHLECGTVRDNNMDMITRGRARNGVSIGERNGRAKLTQEQVLMILASPRDSDMELAARLGVSDRSIRRIRRGSSWKHLRKATPTTAPG